MARALLLGAEYNGNTAVHRRQREDPCAIRLSRKTGLPVGPKACTEEDDDVKAEQASLSGASLAPPPRKKDETPEEKKARKEAVKEAKVNHIASLKQGCCVYPP